MPIEKLLIYLVLGAIFFAKFLADTLKRQRRVRTAERLHEPAAPARNVRGFKPAAAFPPAEARRPSAPRPAMVSERRDLASGAARPARKLAAQPTRQPPTEPARRHRVALGERAELRRAVELMAILGPPRSLAPYE